MLLPAGIVMASILAPFLTGFSSYEPGHERKALNLTILAGIFIAMAVLFPSEKKLQNNINLTYPKAAVDYLRAHGGGGHMFHEYNWGGYLEWTMPEQRVFIDSRTDIFEYKGVLREFLDVRNLTHPEKILDKYKVDSILMRPDTPLNVWLDLQPNWQLAYHDYQSVVYIRRP
jgi:hypothetical protein